MYRKQNRRKSYAAKRRVLNPSTWTSQGALDTEQEEALSQENRGPENQVEDAAAEFSAAPTAQEPAPASVDLTAALAPEQVEANFIKEFYANGTRHEDIQADNGFVMSPSRAVCLIRRDALPQTKSPLTDSSIDTLKTPWGGIDAEAVAALGLAKNTKKQVILGPAGSEVRINIDVLLRGVKALGGNKIKMATAAKDGVFYLGNPEGDRVCLAPVVGPVDAYDITYNEALANYRTNPSGSFK